MSKDKDVVKLMINKLKDKKVFFDFDGVLGVYQATPSNVHLDLEEFITAHMLGYGEGPGSVFDTIRPTHTMMKVVDSLDSNNLYLLSVAETSFESKNKTQFLNKYYPNIPTDHHIYVADNKFKLSVLNNLHRMGKLPSDKKNIVLIEDTISIIRLVEEQGYRCYHISSFL